MDADINDRLLCAARALLRWRQTDLAAISGVPVVYIRQAERGGAMRPDHLEAVKEALHRAGVLIVNRTTVDGAKVKEGVLLVGSAKPKAPFEKRVYPPRPAPDEQAAETKAPATVPSTLKGARRSRSTKPPGETPTRKPASPDPLVSTFEVVVSSLLAGKPCSRLDAAQFFDAASYILDMSTYFGQGRRRPSVPTPDFGRNVKKQRPNRSVPPADLTARPELHPAYVAFIKAVARYQAHAAMRSPIGPSTSCSSSSADRDKNSK